MHKPTPLGEGLFAIGEPSVRSAGFGAIVFGLVSVGASTAA